MIGLNFAFALFLPFGILFTVQVASFRNAKDEQITVMKEIS